MRGSKNVRHFEIDKFEILLLLLFNLIIQLKVNQGCHFDLWTVLIASDIELNLNLIGKISRALDPFRNVHITLYRPQTSQFQAGSLST